MPQSLFQGHENIPDSDQNTGKVEVPYRVWFAAGVVASFIAVWSTVHYELFAKIAWTIIGPGFTFSQTWNNRHDLLSRLAFGILVVVHLWLMAALFPHLPTKHFGYILVLGIAEIITLGLAYQVWMHLRSDRSAHS